MDKVSLKQIAIWSGGKLNAPEEAKVNNAVIDSRNAVKGSLFICLKGEKSDGHDFCGQVQSAGGYCLGEKDNCDIVVESSERALAELAKNYIAEKKCRLIAVTGSAGKTTTVRMISQILSQTFQTVGTPKNFNNQIGLPLTLLRAKNSTKYVVAELGANHKGEIGYLSKIADPDIGIITNIGNAHIGYFKSRDDILNTKLELFDYIYKKKGYIIYNYDDKSLRRKASDYKYTTNYGLNKNADFSAEIIDKDAGGTDFKINGKNFRLNVPGLFNLYNALAALTITAKEGISLSEGMNCLKDIKLPGQRFERVRKGKYDIIDDAYNANPEAVKLLFKEISDIYSDKKIIAVIGEMRELGKFSKKLHFETGKSVGANENVGWFIASGKYKDDLAKGAKKAGMNPDRIKIIENNVQAAGVISEIYTAGDLIVLKASRLQKFEEIIDNLK